MNEGKSRKYKGMQKMENMKENVENFQRAEDSISMLKNREKNKHAPSLALSSLTQSLPLYPSQVLSFQLLAPSKAPSFFLYFMPFSFFSLRTYLLAKLLDCQFKSHVEFESPYRYSVENSVSLDDKIKYIVLPQGFFSASFMRLVFFLA